MQYLSGCRREGNACYTPSTLVKEASLELAAGPDPEVSYRHGLRTALKVGPTWAQAGEGFHCEMFSIPPLIQLDKPPDEVSAHKGSR